MLRDRTILMLAVGQTLVWAGVFYVFPASLARWEADLGWAKSELTLAVTLAILASALAAPVAGRLIDRGWGAALIGLSAAIAGGAVALIGQVQALWQFYALWLVLGVCFAGCLYEPCFAMVTRARGAAAKPAIIWITLIAGFAGTVSFPAVHFLSEAFGWRGAMQVLGMAVTLGVAVQSWVSSAALALCAFGAVALSLVCLWASAVTPVLLGAFVLLFGGAYGTVSILRPVLVRELLGQASFGAKSGELALMYLTGSAVSAYLGALLWPLGGYGAMLATLIALTALGALLFSGALGRRPRG